MGEGTDADFWTSQILKDGNGACELVAESAYPFNRVLMVSLGTMRKIEANDIDASV